MSTTESQALTTIPEDRGVSASSTPNPGQVTDTLKRAMEKAHLISPSTTCPNLPLGCEVAFSSVLVNERSETYPIPGSKNLGLSKVALDRIGKAAGITWDPKLSQRTDDGMDPHYASYKAVGTYRHFDGTLVQVIGEKQMDLREGSEFATKMTSGELSMARKFVAEHAETKARLRAIRSLGIATSYSPEDIKKPFVVAKLMFTGRTDDPEIQKIFAQETARSMLGASDALYGARMDFAKRELTGASPEQSEQKEQPKPDEAARAWIVPAAFTKHKDKPIDDPSITDSDLSGMIDLCLMVKENEMMRDQHEVFAEYQKEIEAEVARRQKGEEKY